MERGGVFTKTLEVTKLLKLEQNFIFIPLVYRNAYKLIVIMQQNSVNRFKLYESTTTLLKFMVVQ